MRTRMLLTAGAFAALALATGMVSSTPALAQSAPRYEVDMNWPKPLPNRWILGGLGGLCVDANDHVLILNRQDLLPGELNGGTMAPQMIEFDADGNVVNSWNDSRLDQRLHSCHFDKDGNVWVGAAPSGMVQKFSHDGKQLLLTIGQKGKLDSSDGTDKGKPLNTPGPTFFMPSSIYVDRTNGDVYVSDGEGANTNRRVAVFDSTGKFLRHWVIDDMESVHCLSMANDGTLYVCNRQGYSIRTYDKMGKRLSSIPVPWTPVTAPANGVFTQSGGAAVAIDFSPDPAQRLIFVINQNNAQVEIIDRASGRNLGSFGRPGSFPGQMNQAHGIAVDSKGNVYVDENRGRRVQKFKPAG